MVDDQQATVAAVTPEATVPPGVAISTAGAAGLVTLDLAGPAARLTAAMRAQIAAAFLRFARDPNTYGVVIRSAKPATFMRGDRADDGAWLSGLTSEQLRTELAARSALIWQLECFSKPTLSFIDGAVSGAGLGLTLNGTHRIAGPHYSLDLAESVAGVFPDNGTAYHLARMPDHIGLYLAMTGRKVGAADAFALGLVTQCAGSDAVADIVAGVRDAMPVDPLLAKLHRPPSAGPIDPDREVIRRCFAGGSVEDIVQRLTSEVSRGAVGARFSAGVLADLAVRAPLALKVAYRHVREAAALDLRQVLIRDYRLSLVSLESHDVRAARSMRAAPSQLRPQWQPADLVDVSAAQVGRYFEPRPGDELVLPIRREMQAARV